MWLYAAVLGDVMLRWPSLIVASVFALGACPVPDVNDFLPDAMPTFADAGIGDSQLRFDAALGERDEGDAGGEVAIAQITPNTGLSTGGYRVRIVGEGFTVDTQVTFGEVLGDNVLLQNSGSLTVRVPSTETSGPVNVTVDNGAFRQTLEAGFIYFDALGS